MEKCPSKCSKSSKASSKRGTGCSNLVANELFLDPGKDDSFCAFPSESTDNCNKQELTIICLPSYIIHSHKLSKNCANDVSKEYNIQLRNCDNENLYVTCHQELLHIMSQYVYYRKLCIWIKEELQKKRMELLEAARKALLDARKEQEFLCIGETTVDPCCLPKCETKCHNKCNNNSCGSSVCSDNSQKCPSKCSQESYVCTKTSKKPKCKAPKPNCKPPKKHKKCEDKTRKKHACRRSVECCEEKPDKKCVIL